jgi:hypothetical protein
MPFRLRIALTLVVLPMAMSAQDRSYARSMVITPDGIVATSHVPASIAGAQGSTAQAQFDYGLAEMQAGRGAP